MNNEQEHIESRHFKEIWNRVICPVRSIVFSECDESFRESVHLSTVREDIWKKALEESYRNIRQECKTICYGNNADDHSLDSRKIASIFCKSLLKHKYYKFELNKALEFFEKLKSENNYPSTEINNWVVNNLLINYKLAYLVSLQLIYLTLLDELLSDPNVANYGKLLGKLKNLYKYPRTKAYDSFDTNMVIFIAHSDILGNDFDVLLYSMQLYQIEMYTKERLMNST